MRLLYAFGAGAAGAPAAGLGAPGTTRNTGRLGCCLGRRSHRVSLKLAGETKLAELVAYEIFRDVHRNKLLAVVYGNGVAHHFRDDG